MPAAMRVAWKPSAMRCHTWEKYSLEGSMIGPHFFIVNSPRSSSGT